MFDQLTNLFDVVYQKYIGAIKDIANGDYYTSFLFTPEMLKEDLKIRNLYKLELPLLKSVSVNNDNLKFIFVFPSLNLYTQYDTPIERFSYEKMLEGMFSAFSKSMSEVYKTFDYENRWWVGNCQYHTPYNFYYCRYDAYKILQNILMGGLD